MRLHRVALALIPAVVLGGCFSWMVKMPGDRNGVPRRPASRADERRAAALRDHVEALAHSPRSVWSDGLDSPVAYLATRIREMGGEPRLHTYEFSGIAVSNVEVELRGSTDAIVIVGAHYDTVDGTPGADDNASGVAAVLELLRILRQLNPTRTIRFVFFVNEEPPYFQTERMGSLVYADRSRALNEDIVAMISVESIGFYSDAEGSQSFPPGVGLFYPDRGDFIGFVGGLGSGTLVRRSIGIFRESADIPSEGIIAPMIVPGVGWSDHWSFAVDGYAAIMVTDTALFRNPHYHSAQDTPDTLDYRRMAKVVRGLAMVVAELAGARPDRRE